MINLRYERGVSQFILDRVAYAETKGDSGLLVELAKQIGRLVNTPGGVMVTSGHAENISLVLHSAYYFNEKPRVLCSVLDDPAVFTGVAPPDMPFDLCPVDRNGQIVYAEYTKLLGNKPTLVILTAVNDETGVVSDISKLAKLAKEAGAKVFLDASGAARFMKMDDIPDTVDIVAFDSPKVGGPSGVGAMWMREDYEIAPFFVTMNTYDDFNALGVAGMAAAIEEACDSKHALYFRTEEVRDAFDGYMKSIPGVTVNCESAPRCCHISSYNLEGVDTYILYLVLYKIGILVAYTAEGYAETTLRSPLMTALHGEDARSNITIKLSAGLTAEEVPYCVKTIRDCYEELKNLNGE